MSRVYEQKARAESAAGTRQAILDAVYKELERAPTEPVSMDRVARRASVARSTIYVVFGSRAGLFDALGADLYERAGYPKLLEAVRVDDALDAMRGGIRTGANMYAAFRDVFNTLHSMAKLDPEAVGGAIHRIEDERAGGMTWLAGFLDEQGYLKPGVGRAEAAHTLWMLTGFDGFDVLYDGRGLSARRTGEILIGIAERAVCH